MIKEKIITKKDGTITKIVVLEFHGLEIVLRPTDATAWKVYKAWVDETTFVQGGGIDD